MKTYSIFGMQWGDEGKGKAVDYLSQKADVIVRYQGGNNAGHTIVVNGEKIVLNLLPSGVLNEKAQCVLSHGMVVNPEVFLKEVDALESKGLSSNHIIINERAHVIFPYHIEMDKLFESQEGTKIGTTKKGIGPCYENKVRRTGIRFIDFFDEDNLKAKLKINLDYYNRLFKAYNKPEITLESFYGNYLEHFNKMKFRIKETANFLYDSIHDNKVVVFEGAQGTMLDMSDGVYPYVTSSHPSLGGIGIGTSLPPHYVKRRIGILKAYTSKVGDGPFPTEQDNEIGEGLRSRGAEFGSVTGRPRRCGWLDLTLASFASRLNDMTDIVMTKFDILSGLSKIQVGIGYEYKGTRLTEIPNDASIMGNLKVIYKEFDGFTLEDKVYSKFEDFPANAKTYLHYIEDFLKVPLLFISVGPEREANVWKNSLPF